MNERDKELAERAGFNSFDTECYEGLDVLIDLIRADEREAAEERVVDLFTDMETPYLPDITRAIRARGNT